MNPASEPLHALGGVGYVPKTQGVPDALRHPALGVVNVERIHSLRRFGVSAIGGIVEREIVSAYVQYASVVQYSGLSALIAAPRDITDETTGVGVAVDVGGDVAVDVGDGAGVAVDGMGDSGG